MDELRMAIYWVHSGGGDDDDDHHHHECCGDNCYRVFFETLMVIMMIIWGRKGMGIQWDIASQHMGT